MGEQIADMVTETNPPRIFPSNTTERLLQDIYYEMRTANERLLEICSRMTDIDQRLTKLEASPFFRKFFNLRGNGGNRDV